MEVPACYLITISPQVQKKAQSAVKVVENLFEKALKNNKDVVDSGELMKFAHSLHTAKPCPVVDVKKEKKKRLSLRFLYPEIPEGVSDRSHKKRQKAESMTVILK